MSNSWLIGLTQGMPTDRERLEKALESLPLEELTKLAQDLELTPRRTQTESLFHQMVLADNLGRQLAREYGDLEKMAWLPTGAMRGLIGHALHNPRLGMAGAGAALGAAGGAVKGLTGDPGVDAYGQPRSRLGAMASGAMRGGAWGGALGGIAGSIPAGGGMNVAQKARQGLIGQNSTLLNPALKQDLRMARIQASGRLKPSTPAPATATPAAQQASGGWWDRLTQRFRGAPAAAAPAAPAAPPMSVADHMRESMRAGGRMERDMVASNMQAANRAGSYSAALAPPKNGFAKALDRARSGNFGIMKAAQLNKLAMSPPPIPGSIGHRLAQSAAAARASRPTVESMAQKMLAKRPPPIPGQPLNLPPIVG